MVIIIVEFDQILKSMILIEKINEEQIIYNKYFHFW